MSVVIGWDIGGAHLKAARVKDGRVEAVVQAATPLWLGLDSLESAFDVLCAQLGRADRHVITMTGELCDAFPSRHEGVAGLAAIAADVTTRLSDGLAKIENIRLAVPQAAAQDSGAARPDSRSAHSHRAGLIPRRRARPMTRRADDMQRRTH